MASFASLLADQAVDLLSALFVHVPCHGLSLKLSNSIYLLLDIVLTGILVLLIIPCLLALLAVKLAYLPAYLLCLPMCLFLFVLNQHA